MQVSILDFEILPETANLYKVENQQISMIFYIKSQKFVFENFNALWNEN